MGQSCSVSTKESTSALTCCALTHKCAVTKADQPSIPHEQLQFHASYQHKNGEHRKCSKPRVAFSAATSTASTSVASDSQSIQCNSSETCSDSQDVSRFTSENSSWQGDAPSVRCSSCVDESQDTPTKSLTGSMSKTFNLVSWCSTVDSKARDQDGERHVYKLADAPSKSAPSFLERESIRSMTLNSKKGSAAHECMDDGGDCLPPDGVVWVEGQNRPQPLTTVAAGQRVLCHDIAFGGIKYAPVTDARVEEQGQVDWVEIVLQDGTTLPMTTDHPMKTEGPGNPVRAADINPKQDSVMVLKLVPVPVERINKCIGLGSKRASVAVAQPSRHTLLVGSHGRGELMSVGSVDLGEIPRLKEELTFLHLQNDEKCERAQRRANSAPPMQVCDLRSSSKTTTTNTPDSECGSLSESQCDSAAETFESFEECKDTEMILVGTTLEGVASNSFVRLSDLLNIKAKGWKSHGSQDHATHQCRVCVFENRFFYDGGSPCFKGRLCEYCHDDHPRSNRLKKRGTRAGHKMDNRCQANKLK